MSAQRASGDHNLLSELIHQLRQLPGVGEKTATRLSYFILRQPQEYAEALASAVSQARSQLYSCEQCCNFTEDPVCRICAHPNRTDEVLCVVEEPSDVTAFERTHNFHGKYHVLHGALSPLEGITEGKLRIKQLQDRIRERQVKEVILATNPTTEGDTTALYIARLIKYNDVKVSRIALGIPVGAEIEYLDSATLGKALENRVSM